MKKPNIIGDTMTAKQRLSKPKSKAKALKSILLKKIGSQKDREPKVGSEEHYQAWKKAHSGPAVLRKASESLRKHQENN